MSASSHMYREAAGASEAVRLQLQESGDSFDQLGTLLRARAPRAVVTCARGSSDHAATYAKYLIETRLGLITSSAAPSTSSLYFAKQDFNDVLFLAISQSGASSDLLAAAAAAKTAGALVFALVNAEDSPLSRSADYTIPLRAGIEKSVAATKSYIASLAALAQLVAAWCQDQELQTAIAHAPEQLQLAWELDWGAATDRLAAHSNLYVVGRGIGLAVAQEAALKLKETCGMHAEAFSAAELKHGPLALVRAGFPVLVFVQDDEARKGTEELAAELVSLGADVLIAGAQVAGAISLPTEHAHSAIEPMLMIQSFYRMANALALARGLDPDRPPNLRKVTVTL